VFLYTGAHDDLEAGFGEFTDPGRPRSVSRPSRSSAWVTPPRAPLLSR
jgi:hypothetical protein